MTDRHEPAFALANERGTGRTTRMLQMAVKEALEGHKVVVVTDDVRYAKALENKVIQLHLDIEFTSRHIAVHKDGILNEKYRDYKVFFDHSCSV